MVSANQCTLPVPRIDEMYVNSKHGISDVLRGRRLWVKYKKDNFCFVRGKK